MCAKRDAVGEDSNPLVIEWEGEPPPPSATPPRETSQDMDYETLTLMRLHNAELRKRAIIDLEKD